MYVCGGGGVREWFYINTKTSENGMVHTVYERDCGAVLFLPVRGGAYVCVHITPCASYLFPYPLNSCQSTSFLSPFWEKRENLELSLSLRFNIWS